MLYFLVFLCSISWLVYQLLLWTISSYLVWNSILQFSITIWLFLTWLWIGSYIVRLFKNNIKTFFIAELSLWIVWWFSVFLIKFLYIYFFNTFVVFYIFYIIITLTIWAIVWLEIPIIADIIDKEKKRNKDNSTLKDVVADVFTYDYVWALIATFLFPFILLPWIWVGNSAILMWLLNIFIALLFIYTKNIKKHINVKKYTLWFIFILIFYVFIAIWLNSHIENLWDKFFYKDTIIYHKKSHYQDIVMTKRWGDIRLYLDGNLQFMSLDEHRYHACLWKHWKNYIQSTDKKYYNILILWWWDGLLARNIVKTMKNKNYQITLIELDSAMINLAKTNKVLKTLNKDSLNNKHVKVINEDAFTYLAKDDKTYDIIIADFPDPRNVSLAKLYSKEFYNLVYRRLSSDGIFTTQAWNAFFANKSFWCIYKTLKWIFSKIIAYHAYIPSFGDWWYVSASKKDIFTWTNKMIDYDFDEDYKIDMNKIKINTLDNPIIIQYYINWRKKFNL